MICLPASPATFRWFEGHQFAKFDDRILVVNSASRVVVAMIPRYKLLP